MINYNNDYVEGRAVITCYDKANNFVKNITIDCLFGDRNSAFEKLTKEAEAEGFKSAFCYFYMK